jgi:hypothetical protein
MLATGGSDGVWGMSVTNKAEQPDDEKLSASAAAARFGVSHRTLVRWAEQGLIRRQPAGASVTYVARDIVALLTERYVTVLAHRQQRDQATAAVLASPSTGVFPGVADDLRWVRTVAQTALMHEARAYGARCGWCGRGFQVPEPLCIERFRTGEMRHRRDGPVTHRTISQAPVGQECASPELLHQLDRLTPDTCVNCGRAVYYRLPQWRQRVPCCSRLCSRRVQKRRREASS